MQLSSSTVGPFQSRGLGREEYRDQQEQVLGSSASLVEEESSHAVHCGLLHALIRWNAPLRVAERLLSIAPSPPGITGTSLLDSCDEGRGVG